MNPEFDAGARTPVGAGIEVPALCFGAAPLSDMPGTYGYEVDVERARATVREILAGPCPFIDTSRNYGAGRAEERVGDVIRELGGLPAGAVLSTKLDRDMDSRRFDAAQARRSLEQSLRTLGIDRVPMLHLHDPEHAASLDEVTRADGALRELHKMKEEGLAGVIGLAAGRVDVMMPIVRDWDFDVMITHSRFTLVNRNASELIDLARARGVAVLNAAPYSGGVLAKGVEAFPRYVYQAASDEMLGPVREVESLCAQHGIPLGAAALQFSIRDSRIASTICGVSKPERVAQTLEWASLPIPDALWSALDALAFSVDDPEATREYRPD